MRIGIDISQVVYGTGVSVYIENLVRNLLVIDRENQYILFGGFLRRKKDLESFTSSLSGRFNVKLILFPPTLADIVWNRLHLLKIERFIGKVDVFHSPDWTMPPSKAFKVATVHDLTPLKFSRITNPKLVSAHKARLKWVNREADRIIVPSQETKKDLLELGFNEGRIRVIPEAPDAIFKPVGSEKIGRLKKTYGIGGKYLLAIGVNPRKNTDRIIEAYEKVRAGEELKLVVIGHPYIKHAVPRGVRFVGHIPTGDLPGLYSGAEALVYPSLYEGYGLPILEAFACGCPVVTSNTSSMPEVAGDAAVLVDPYSVTSIVEGIKKALAGPKGLTKKGLERVKGFSWEKAALETLNVYKESSK